MLALLSISVAFTLFGLLHGVATALDGIIDRIAADRMRVQGLGGPGIALPISYANQIGQIAGVTTVTATVLLRGYYQDPKNTLAAVAYSNATPLLSSKIMQISGAEADAFARTKSGAVVHRALANRFGWKLGNRIPFRSGVMKKDRNTLWEFEVVGLYDTQDPFWVDQLWFRYDYLDDSRVAANGTAQAFLITTSDPQHNAAVADAIDERFANSSAPTATQSDREWAQAGMEQAIDFNVLVKAIVGSSLFTLLLVTGNTMMESVRQRIPELAVLKTVGYSNQSILVLVISESGLIYLIGAGTGLLLSTTLFPLIAPHAGSERIGMPLPVIAQGAAIALATALVSAAAPALLAHRLSIVEALRRP
ncbi:ABC transporter permease [Steroidobacter sp.]|uniref:ABC transporter permease n=1 Tax=Steroidobacter sp. TaxID=1978227 RepID=UPI001A5A1FB0|nr:ABC transporter permease [Steroidobacter sp.]MBL8266551.1 ABC transporter permease [Steroidobacter sp.]